MFTGIIATTGKLKKIEKLNSKIYFTIEAKKILKELKIGDSITCDGVCLTVVKKNKDSFQVELMPETLRKTKFSESKIHDSINLELPLQLGARLHGHFVLGHVDGVGRVKKIIQEGEYRELVISVSKKLIKYIANKGSITINGVSLTISDVGSAWLKTSLISHTLKITNLGNLKIKDKVNIEVDMLARYLDQLTKK